MRITGLLIKELVFPAVDARGSDEVIGTLGMRLAAYHRDVDRDGLVHALRERERQVTTALGDGVAIPHARLAGPDPAVAAVGGRRDGGPREALDWPPAHPGFLLARAAGLPRSLFQGPGGVLRPPNRQRC